MPCFRSSSGSFFSWPVCPVCPVCLICPLKRRALAVPYSIHGIHGIQKYSTAHLKNFSRYSISSACWDMLRCCPFTIFYHLLPHLSSTSFNFQLQKTMCWMCFQYTAIHYLVIIRQYTASLHSCLTPWSRQPRNSWHITLNNKCQADSETPCSLKCQGDSLR